jgi:hypothetical protein
LPEEEIVGGEHPCEHCGVGGEDLLSVGNPALIGGAADGYANPAVVVFGSPGISLTWSSTTRMSYRSSSFLMSMYCHFSLPSLYYTHK